MSRTNEEHAETEGFLKRFRPQEPAGELKARVIRSAWGAWHETSAGVPWQIPLRRLAASAVAAAILISLANRYGDCAPTRHPTGIPAAGHVEPCDLDVMTAPQTLLARYAVTAGRPTRPDASSLLDYLDMVRETLRETEHDDASDEPVPAERRSHLFPNLPIRHS